MHLYGNKLYYNASDDGEGDGQDKLYSFDLDTGIETLELDISETYPGYYIAELGLKRGRLVLVLSDKRETRCKRLVIAPETLNSSEVFVEEITFYNRYVSASVIVRGAVDNGYTYTSVDESIATVDDFGDITAVGVGTTTVIIRDAADNVVTTCKVIVDNSFFATNIEIIGAPDKLRITCNAIMDVGTDYTYAKLNNILWSSSDENIASVYGPGMVSANVPGTVIISAKDLDSGCIASCTITVVELGIEINEKNFPDEIFREYVRRNFDIEIESDGVLTEEEIEEIIKIDVSGMEITSLCGIEYFVKLQELECANTCIMELDISKNTDLRELGCGNTRVTSLDVSKNKKLSFLWSINSNLAFLDISNNNLLNEIGCYGNIYDLGLIYESFDLSNIPGFDVSRASNWVGATCENGKLTDFEESGGMVSVNYIYDCGNGFFEEFTIVAELVDENHGAVEFINRMYEDILHRTPDEGSRTWVNLLLNGTFTGAEVAKGFIMSEEFLNKDMSNEEFVRILYQAFFGREADTNGLTAWTDFLNNGYRKSYVFTGFANSEEFRTLCEEYGVDAGEVPVTVSEQQPNLSDKEYNVWLFVERMYTEVLKRIPDMSGLKEWVDALQNGYTKKDIFAGFAYSNEFEVLCNSYGITRGNVAMNQ